MEKSHINNSDNRIEALVLTNTEKTQVIEETLINYQSINFPQGVLKVCSNFKIKTENDKQILISLTMPFLCQGS